MYDTLEHACMYYLSRSTRHLNQGGRDVARRLLSCPKDHITLFYLVSIRVNDIVFIGVVCPLVAHKSYHNRGMLRCLDNGHFLTIDTGKFNIIEVEVNWELFTHVLVLFLYFYFQYLYSFMDRYAVTSLSSCVEFCSAHLFLCLSLLLMYNHRHCIYSTYS